MELRGESTTEKPRAIVSLPSTRRGGPIQSAIYARLLGLLRPIERGWIRAGLNADQATWISLATAFSACVAAVFGALALAGILYLLAGLLDLLDGRIARLTQTASPRGAALDSIVDRFAEGLVVSGLAWLLRDTAGLALCLVFLTASMSVSYARARGEGLGVSIEAGMMNRGPRVALFGLAMTLEGLFSEEVPSFPFLLGLFGLALLTLVTAALRVTLVLRALPGAPAKGIRDKPRPRLRRLP